MKRYKPSSEDVAMLNATNAGNIRNRIITRKLSGFGDWLSMSTGTLRRFTVRWFQDNTIEIMCCVLIVGAVSCGVVLWIETLPDPVLLAR
jgi:hypothetical protein